jgi:ubiquinone/menaquinone biosynthesis C-methylase UbiE
VWEGLAEVLFGPGRWLTVGNEVDALIELGSVPAGARVLDMCCGPGRHALELARRDFAVTGVDRTEAYLDRARERAAADGLEVEWLQADMRHFCRPE